MNATPIGTVGQDLTQDEWLALRKQGIGGSEAPAIAGAVDWASPMSIYLDKLGLVEPQDFSDNQAVEWGNRLEVPVTEKVEEVTGHAIHSRQGFYSHPDYPWMLATVDGITANDVDNGLVEIKTTGSWRAKTWKDDVPLHVWIQTQHDMAVVDLPWAIVGVLIGGQKFELHHVARDDTYIAQLIELERAFVENHLRPQIPPPIDGSKASEDALRILFSTDDGSEIVTDDADAEALASDYLQAKADESAAKKRKTVAANGIKNLLGNAQAGTLSGKYRVTWKTIQRDGYEVKASSYRKLNVVEMEVE
jgi:putative phage-type endonuclease